MMTQHLVVGRREANRSLAAFLHTRLRLPWTQARHLIHEGNVKIANILCRDPDRYVLSGQRIQVRQASAAQKLPVAQRPTIRFVDEQIVVVDKPAGLTTMRHPHEAAEFGERAKRFLPPTLADLLPDLLPKGRRDRSHALLSVHRIDKETSGLVVFARTSEAARHLGRQFREHTIERRYLALVRGHAQAGRLESFLVRDRGDGRRGSSHQTSEGERAVTQIRVIEILGDYTLVECQLETGRTHQVRIHLGEADTPLCGEHIYDRPLHGQPMPDGSGAKRVTLHAAYLGLTHPATGKSMHWTAALPADMRDLLVKFRKQKPRGNRSPQK